MSLYELARLPVLTHAQNIVTGSKDAGMSESQLGLVRSISANETVGTSAARCQKGRDHQIRHITHLRDKLRCAKNFSVTAFIEVQAKVVLA
jgi:hypothetical protein